MKPILIELRAAVVSTLILATVCCGAYPLAVWAIAQAAFPHQANGSLLLDAAGQPRGSSLIGQSFAGGKYFHPRPSAAGSGAGYDATSSGGSNLGPTSQRLHNAVRQRIADYRALNGIPASIPVPADAVTASASGLDPHISPRNAALQIARVAAARNLNTEFVARLVERHTAPPALGFLGESRVHVLHLNLALDTLPDSPASPAP